MKEWSVAAFSNINLTRLFVYLKMRFAEAKLAKRVAYDVCPIFPIVLGKFDVTIVVLTRCRCAQLPCVYACILANDHVSTLSIV